ncbi:hypothetical protein ABN028_31540 [Actinopolymorpha sp. B17G11]|uniref:hypothetical protein n=1 Tax=unclassified Actinopolymorpha TaxID=2627063 RepID=UPI0032E39377
MAHRKLKLLKRDGFVILDPYEGRISPEEWESLNYLDWKSGGDTNFAVLASADGTDDPRGFWEYGKPDKDGVWTENIQKAPTLKRWVESSGVRYGRVRIIKLNPSSNLEEVQTRFLHQDDNNRLNPDGEGWVVRAWMNLTDDPDSYMVLREDKDDPSTERHIPLPRNAQFLVDTERLWHAVYHPGPEPRYAMITSFESGPELEKWVRARMPK